MTTPLRVCLAGYGLAGRVFHAPLIAAEPGLRLTTVITSAPERAAQARADIPGVNVAPDLATVLTGPEPPDLVVVATANRVHVPLAHAALQAGCHVVVDKPLAVTAREAAALVLEAERADRVLTVFQNRRWDSDLLTVRRLLADGTLGDLLRLESRFDRWRPQPRTDAWRESTDPADGGGLLLDLGVHLVDQAIALLGRPDTVYAEIDNRRAPHSPDDDVFIALGYPGGVYVHLWASALAAEPGVRMRALGSRAGYVSRWLDPQEQALRDGRRPGDGAPWGVADPSEHGELVRGAERTPVTPEPGDWPSFYRSVAAAVQTGTAPPVDAWDAVTVLLVLEAARRSAARSEVVRVEGA